MSAFDFRAQGLEALRPTLSHLEAICSGEEPMERPGNVREALRAGARDHADWQAATVCARPFPAGRYPVTLAEVCGQVELQARMIEALQRQGALTEERLAALDRWCAAADRWREAGPDN